MIAAEERRQNEGHLSPERRAEVLHGLREQRTMAPEDDGGAWLARDPGVRPPHPQRPQEAPLAPPVPDRPPGPRDLFRLALRGVALLGAVALGVYLSTLPGGALVGPAALVGVVVGYVVGEQAPDPWPWRRS